MVRLTIVPGTKSPVIWERRVGEGTLPRPQKRASSRKLEAGVKKTVKIPEGRIEKDMRFIWGPRP